MIPQAGKSGRHRTAAAASDLLAMVRAGQHPFLPYNAEHLGPRIAAALARILQTCHTLFGNLRQMGAVRCKCPKSCI